MELPLSPGWSILTSFEINAAGAMLVVALTFANACLWFNASVDIRRVQEEVTLIGPRPKILMLSAAAVIGHPMVREVGGTWVSRQGALWVREIVRRALEAGTIDQAAADRLAGYVARERADLSRISGSSRRTWL